MDFPVAQTLGLDAHARSVLGFDPDPNQRLILDPTIRRCILNCSRQWGKSTIVAFKVFHYASNNPDRLCLIASPSERQSGEFIRKVRTFVRRAGMRPRTDGQNDLSLLFPNGSRIVGIPGKEDTTRGFSAVSMLIVDEASRVDDEFYYSLTAMVATVPDASIWLLSTPNGRTGFFYEEWSDPAREWTRIAVPGTECPRISPAHLAEQRRRLGERRFAQEYLCAFAPSDMLFFDAEQVRALFDPEIPALFTGRIPPVPPSNASTRILGSHFFLGVDLGKSRDYSAVAIVERRTTTTGLHNPVNFEPIRDVRLYLRFLERIPLNTAYTDVVDRILGHLDHPEIASQATLVVDGSGVGAPVYDMLRSMELRCPLIAVTITDGETASVHNGLHRVPRVTLLSTLQRAVRERAIPVAPDAPAAEDFKTELLRFSLHTSTRDDLVFAASLAVWRATLEERPIESTRPLPGIAPMFVR